MRPLSARRRDSPACSTCSVLSVCAAVIIVCLFGYIPLMFSMKRVPVFQWGPAVDRNTSLYIRPEENTTLLQPPSHVDAHCKPFLLIMVQSAVKNFPARGVIRETWGAAAELPADVTLRFLVGTSANRSLADNLTAENEVHGDLIQQDFVDVYSNLTLKSVMMLKWATGSCSPQFILKVDEDMFINLPNLLRYLRREGRPDMIVGGLICGAAPIADRFSKYYSPRYMFARRRFPMYVSGTAYVLGAGVAGRLYRTALATPLFHLEDVFLTGICAAQIGVRPTDHVGFGYARHRLDPCEFARIVAAHEVQPDQLRAIWRQLRQPEVLARCAAKPTAAPRKLVKCRA